MKGVVMLDVLNGVPRVRQWPKKRGKPKTAEHQAQVDFFRHASWAAKFMHPDMTNIFIKAREGTALLPRDLAFMMLAGTMFIVIHENGRVSYPMQIVSKVSESLDALSQVPGMMLVRGLEFWEPVPYVPPSNAMQLFAEGELLSAGSTITIDNIPDTARDIIIEVQGRKTNTDQQTFVRLNNLSTGIYNDRYWDRGGTNGSTNATAARGALLSSSGAPAGTMSSSEIIIPNYARTDRFKQIKVRTDCDYDGSIANMFTQDVLATCRTLLPVSRVDLVSTSGNFDAGTIYQVYLRGAAI